MPGTFGYADPLFLLIAALALEAYLGRGNWLGSLSRGPRRWVARLARTLEQRLNRPERGAAERRRRGWSVAIALVRRSEERRGGKGGRLGAGGAGGDGTW